MVPVGLTLAWIASVCRLLYSGHCPLTDFHVVDLDSCGQV